MFQIYAKYLLLLRSIQYLLWLTQFFETRFVLYSPFLSRNIPRTFNTMFNYDKQPILYITLIYTVNYLSSIFSIWDIIANIRKMHVAIVVLLSITAVEFNEFMPWYGLIQSMLDRLVKISFFLNYQPKIVIYSLFMFYYIIAFAGFKVWNIHFNPT